MNLIPIRVPMEVSVSDTAIPMSIASDTAIPMSIASDKVAVEMSIGAEYRVLEAEVYDGEYTVAPKAHESQTLETANKLLEENVLVLDVPYFQTSNEYGDTVYIASEV